MADMGYAPYAEAAAKGQARMSTLQRIAQALAGAGQGIQSVQAGAGPLAAGLTGFSRSYILSSAAKRAAEDYAMKQQQADEQRKSRELDDAYKQILIARESKPPAPEKPQKVDPWNLPADEQARYYENIRQEAAAKAKGAPQGTSEDLAPQLTGPSLDMAARRYLEDGTLPPAGMGKAGVGMRAAIINRASALMPGADLAGNVASYQGLKSSLRNLQMSLETNTAFSNTAHQNGEILRQTLTGIPELGTRFGNRVTRWAASQAGSPQVAQFHTALGVLTPEFARILQQGAITGGGVLTDSQRKEMQAVLGPDFTKQQLLGSLDILYRDAANKQNSYRNQINSLNSRLRSKNFLAPQDTTQMTDPLGIR